MTRNKIDAPRDAPAHRQWALLIGINEYAQPHVPNLRGCVNDVNAMRWLLRDRFRVPADNILVLTDAEATRRNILAAFQTHLIDNVGSGDRAFFHYSGHGSQMPDVHGDEIDGLDETIVPHDSRDPQGAIFDITDDELYALLQTLTRRTTNVVLVVDACHSGHITRAVTTVRRIPTDDRVPPPASRKRSVVMREHGPSGFLPADEGYVLISGCRSEELSNEYVVQLKDGKTATFGVLTYHLVQHLIEAPADSTWQDVIAEVGPTVASTYARQHPQAEGAIRRHVFGAGARSEDPAFRVTDVDDQSVTLNGGAAHGLRAGMRVALYPVDAYRFAESAPLAHGHIDTVTAIEATARVEDDTTVPPGARVRLLSPTIPQLKLPVVLADGTGWLRPQLSNSPWVTIEEPDQAEGPVVLRMRDETTIGLDDGSGGQLVNDVSAENVSLLLERLRHIARFRVLMGFHNPDPASALTRAVDLRLGLRGDDGALRAIPRSAGGEPRVTVGQELLLEVENCHDEAVYITVLVLDANGFRVAPLYPLPGSEDNRLAAGRTYRAGTRGELAVTPPPGQTTVLLIATETASHFRSLWMNRMRRSAEPGTLEAVLNRAMARGVSFLEARGETLREDWTVKRTTVYAVTAG